METIKLNIDLSVNQLIQAAKHLSPRDRLKVSDAIWNEYIEIPIEHQRIVLDWMAKANPERLLGWDEVSKTLQILRFQLKIDTDALHYIQETFEWYELCLRGLGSRYKT